MLDPLYIAVSWVLLLWYRAFTAIGLSKDSGLTWALSIVFLVVTARVLLFRFFIKQVHYQRRMQEMQPKIKKLQEKHKGDRATLQREMMALQQAEGFNPISGCLPMLLQIPIFISLFHVLKHISNSVGLEPGARGLTLYGFTEAQTHSAAHAKLWGAPLASSLHDAGSKILLLGGEVTSTRIVTIVLVILSAAATLITQRAVIANQTTPAVGQAATIQRLMLVGIPISVLVSGYIFPLGVLLYWFTSNVWTMAQQFYIFRFHPHTPGQTGPAPQESERAKALAPKVGQKPQQRGRVVRSQGLTPTEDDDSDGVPLDDPTDAAPPIRPSSNGGGNRPAGRNPRTATKRPANRGTPSKKRR